MNPTVAAIVERLPKKPLLNPKEIADAFALQSTRPVLDDIALGDLAAAKVGNRYIIARAEAIRYVSSKAVAPTEGTIPTKTKNAK